jgi:ATP synthase protein I
MLKVTGEVTMTSIPKPPVHRIPMVQLGVLLPLVAVLWWLDPVLAQSTLAGGLLAVIPNLYFSAYAFRYRGARAARLITHAFKMGETGKFMLTLVGFAGVFVLLKPINVAAVFIAYIALTVIQVVVAARVIGRS